MHSTLALLALAATALAAPAQRSCSYACPARDALGGPLVTGFALFGELHCTYFTGECSYSTSTGAVRIPSVGLCPSTALSSCATSSSKSQPSTSSATHSSLSSVAFSASTSTLKSTTSIYVTTSTSTSTSWTSSVTASSATATSFSSTFSSNHTSSPSASTSASSASPSLAAPTTSLPAGWSTAYGCAIDTSSRVFASSEYYQLPDTNTPSACIALCGDRGYSLAGVEYGYECFCASSYANGPPAPANASDCNVPCAGDASQTCGGGLRLQVYTNQDALAEAATLPSGWKQTSPCAVDTPARVFADTVSSTLANNTPAHCIQHCSAMGYTMAGVEDSDECYCGSSYLNNTPPPSASVDQCSVGCKGAPGLTCGGDYAIQLYGKN